MAIADMIERMLAGGVAHDLIVLAVRNIESAFVSGLSRTMADPKEYERLRKRKWRANKGTSKGEAKANDVAIPSPNVPDNAKSHCNSIQEGILSSEKEAVEKKEKNLPVERARGTRLVPDQQITESDWAFAINAGMTAAAARQAWAEFVDYWIALPGKRGLKTKWDATWRNRVRELIKRGDVNGRNDPKSVLAAADRLIDHFGGMEAARSYVPGSSGPQPPRLDFGEGETGVRLIPKR